MRNILILFGGRSSEYEVSLQSAYSVIKNIPRDKYTVTLVGITKDGKWLLFEGDIENIPCNKWFNDNCSDAMISADYADKCLIVFREGHTEKIKIDACFPVLHGKNGEDGTVQGLLKLSGIPFVGCDTLASAMCMDKAITNTIADYANIPQAKWLSCTNDEYYENKDVFVDKCIEKLGLPVFIKPANAGSSVGISKAKSKDDIFTAMDIAFKEDSKVVAEENISGREVECAVLGNEKPIASLIGEIIPESEFYDYEAKYINGTSKLSIPAVISNEKSDEIRSFAVKAFKAMGCSGLSRVDFFIRNSDEKVLFNEINTLPGFTSISMYSKLFDASGIPYGELIDNLINLALEKNK